MFYIEISNKLKSEINHLSEFSDNTIFFSPEKFEIAVNLIEKRHFEEINKIKLLIEKNGYLVIKNLPIEVELPYTPKTPDEVIQKKHYVSEINLVFIGYIIGKIFSFEDENKNKIHNVFPSINHQEYNSSLGSIHHLSLHTEIAFSKFKPDYISLICVRKSKNLSPTLLCDMKKVFEAVPKYIWNIIQNEDYFIKQPATFKSETIYRKIKAIELEENNNFSFFFNFIDGMMVSLSQKSHEALNVIKEYVYELKEEVLLEEGHAIVIDNHRFLHGRDQIQANFDGFDRWLQRIYIRKK